MTEKAKVKKAEYMRNYFRTHKENVARSRKKWREKNKEHIKEYQRKYRQQHKDKVKEYNAKYWEKKAGVSANDSDK